MDVTRIRINASDPRRSAALGMAVAAGLMLGGIVAAPIALPVIAAQAQVTPPPPACAPGARPTPSQTEGPFFKAGAPQRTSLLEPGITGTKLIVTGYVLTTDCRSVSGARLDFWQADDRGQYDNAGFRLRGHQFTDSAGRYYLETIVPGLYTGRTRHIHVRIQAPNQPALVTQLYLPGETRNQSDGIYNQALLMTVRDTADGKIGTFTFILILK